MAVRKSRAKKDEKIELEIGLKDYGPIGEGKIKIKPLTILMGGNNAGKSYVTMLLQSIFQSASPDSAPDDWPFFMKWQVEQFPEIGQALAQSKEPEKIYKKLQKHKKASVSQQFLQSISKRILKLILEKRLKDKLARAFSCNPGELIREGMAEAIVDIKTKTASVSLALGQKKLKISGFPDLKFDMTIDASKESKYIEMETGKNCVNVNFGKLAGDEEHNIQLIKGLILDACSIMALNNLATDSVYIPAARAGVLQVHKALLAGMVRQPMLFGIKKFEIPWLSGEIADFLSSITGLSGKKGHFYKMGRELEEEMLKGEIVLTANRNELYPEIMYKINNKKVPLYRFSLTVSGMAPLILYLKHKLEPGKVVIIKEPETHLHPMCQLILAKFICRMVREGLYVVISTHSERLINRLNSYILLGNFNKNERMVVESKEDIYLSKDEVSAYMFGKSKDHDYVNIREMSVDSNAGITYQNNCFI